MPPTPPIRYELLDHTADILLRAGGRDMTELFTNGLAGLYAVLGELAGGRETTKRTITLTAENREELFHDWLSEALYYLEAKHEFFPDVRFAELSETGLIADVSAVKMDLDRCGFDREIKAVTYHELAVREQDGRLVATVVLDI